jgi:hypothetical protein
MSIALGCIAFSIATHERPHLAAPIAVSVTVVALLGWVGLDSSWLFRARPGGVYRSKR